MEGNSKNVRKVKATPMGMPFLESSVPEAAKMSDIGNYRIRIEPVIDTRGMVVHGDVCYSRSVNARGLDYALASLDLECKPQQGGQSSRYYIDEDKRYSYHYTKAGISQLLSDITGEPCEIEIIERSK